MFSQQVIRLEVGPDIQDHGYCENQCLGKGPTWDSLLSKVTTGHRQCVRNALVVLSPQRCNTRSSRSFAIDQPVSTQKHPEALRCQCCPFTSHHSCWNVAIYYWYGRNTMGDIISFCIVGGLDLGVGLGNVGANLT